jgi:hypothetical protein
VVGEGPHREPVDFVEDLGRRPLDGCTVENARAEGLEQGIGPARMVVDVGVVGDDQQASTPFHEPADGLDLVGRIVEAVLTDEIDEQDVRVLQDRRRELHGVGARDMSVCIAIQLEEIEEPLLAVHGVVAVIVPGHAESFGLLVGMDVVDQDRRGARQRLGVAASSAGDRHRNGKNRDPCRSASDGNGNLHVGKLSRSQASGNSTGVAGELRRLPESVEWAVWRCRLAAGVGPEPGCYTTRCLR